MTWSVRRVVTGHDADRKAIVTADERIPASAPRPGQETIIVWANGTVPADNLDEAEGPARATGSRLPDGGVFRIVRYAAGASGNMHRTQTLDYGVVVDGSIELELDHDIVVALGPGDVVVQRGTIHRWRNRRAEPCTIAFVLIDALPLPPSVQAG